MAHLLDIILATHRAAKAILYTVWKKRTIRPVEFVGLVMIRVTVRVTVRLIKGTREQEHDSDASNRDSKRTALIPMLGSWE